MRILSGKQLGRLRRFLLVRGEHKWNAIVRDVTAKLG